MDLYGHDPDADVFGDDFGDETLEVEEVEYLEGEWEPELLEVANDDELANFVESLEPDSVLVYNFEESPADILTSPVFDMEDEAVALPEDFRIGAPDFTSLDALNNEEATPVSYIDAFLEKKPVLDLAMYTGGQVFELLEVVGDEDIEELADLEESSRAAEESILSADGLFLVDPGVTSRVSKELDPEFKELVDSVLR